MIRAWLLALCLLVPGLAQGRAVPVRSGEHDGFARLVLSVATGQAWSFGRTGDGYELRLEPGGDVFDLARVHDLIGRDRLAAIGIDPTTGALRLTVGCACHALPYELGKGVLVIDIRDGAPPAGSSFEFTLTGTAMPPLGPPPRSTGPDRPRSRPGHGAPYDWLADRAAIPLASPPPPAIPRPRAIDGGLRDGLLHRLAEGAARGVVTMALPERPAAGTAPSRSLPQIRIGEDLGLVVLPGGAAEDPRATLTPDGQACLTDDALDLAAWLVHPDPASGLGRLRSGLLKEFDVPDRAALAGAVRYLIAIGFGAEARQLIQAFGDAPEGGSTGDVALMTALSYAVDGEVAPAPVFAAMAGCDTAAALWSAIETTGGDLPTGLAANAVIRAFSALPPDLRRHLGVDLTARLIAAGDPVTARALSDAMLRLPGADDAAIQISAARVGLSLGEAQRADAMLEAVSAENGPAAADALIALTEARVATGTAMDAGQIALLAALAQEYRGTAREAPLRRAAVLAMALGGDYDAAFAAVDRAADAGPDLWRLLAAQGSDAALLAHAVGADADAIHASLPDDRRQISARLATLGLPDPALAWLLDGPEATDADRLAQAQAHLGRRDGLAALGVLTGLDDPAAEALKARAESDLGAPERAAPLFARVGDPVAAEREARLAGDWAGVAAGDDPAWASAAALVAGASGSAGAAGGLAQAGDPDAPPDAPDPVTGGPLARGAALLEDAASARNTIDALLVAVPMPAAMEGGPDMIAPPQAEASAAAPQP